MHFNVKSLKNKHTQMIKFVLKTHASGGGRVSAGDFGIDLHYENTPIQIYRKFHLKLKKFR